MRFCKIIFLVFSFAIIGMKSIAQISPGGLSNFHSHLEGISNCTKCHILGEKLSNEKCLECHVELKELVTLNKGYHSSVDVKGKQCAICHSEHHEKNFQIVRFDEKKFNHNLTGFQLIGAHSKKNCKDCHKPKYISSPKILAKKYTYLGLKSACVNCHIDYHQNTLSLICNNCHDANAFKPSTKFNHSSAKYQLEGKHKTVECIKCHKIEILNGVKFQKFKNIQFNSCVNCHIDVHKNKFGQNCLQCHSEESFRIIKGIKNFDHSKTKYKLEEKHLNIDCKLCHKQKITTPLIYKKCIDCHNDFHKNQFAKDGISPDCSKCHSISGFINTLYTIEQHNNSEFPLQGAHIALPCFECHKKSDKWAFKDIGKKCISCHKNIHEDLINKKYYPEDNCLSCHSQTKWSEIEFDHSKTNFNLLGAHKTQTCRKCHFKENIERSFQQKFSMSVNCITCHKDIHLKQFDKNEVTDCEKCHGFDNWNPLKFNHDNTSFKLDGKHKNVQCKNCHKTSEINNNKCIKYKISIKCESCHL